MKKRRSCGLMSCSTMLESSSTASSPACPRCGPTYLRKSSAWDPPNTSRVLQSQTTSPESRTRPTSRATVRTTTSFRAAQFWRDLALLGALGHAPCRLVRAQRLVSARGPCPLTGCRPPHRLRREAARTHRAWRRPGVARTGEACDALGEPSALGELVDGLIEVLVGDAHPRAVAVDRAEERGLAEQLLDVGGARAPAFGDESGRGGD